ncbi:Hypothetical protein DAL_155 [Psychrobacter phage D'Alembert]|nr:Hypothetical protein DAL_12 [Psychrobacter phage D'Alembert]CAH1193570.1 Hypothetical protein DAL_155 [Psychrobacter phage D'Alembert]
MLTINSILKTNPVFILSVNYDAGSLADMLGEYNRDDNSHNEYLAEMTIQYHTISCNACLSFTVECLVSVNDNKVTIEDMQTGADSHSVYANNIKTIPNGSHYVYQGGNSDLKDTLHELMESQPIYDIPEHFIIESY